MLCGVDGLRRRIQAAPSRFGENSNKVSGSKQNGGAYGIEAAIPFVCRLNEFDDFGRPAVARVIDLAETSKAEHPTILELKATSLVVRKPKKEVNVRRRHARGLE